MIVDPIKLQDTDVVSDRADTTGPDPAQAPRAGDQRMAPGESLEAALSTLVQVLSTLGQVLNKRLSESSANQYSKTQLRYVRVGLWLAVIGGVIIPIALFFIGANQREIRDNQQNIQEDVGQLGRQVDSLRASRQPVITSPAADGKVDLKTMVAGTTPLFGMNHYIVVTPFENAVNWVQDEPASVEADGSFRGEAQFGQGDNGIQKTFIVRILATNASIRPGQLSSLPSDATFSEGITVTRQR